MSVLLVCIICAISMCQRGERRDAALIFSMAWAVHMLVEWPDAAAYFAGAFIDVLVIALICKYTNPTMLSNWLLNISAASIVLNCFGFTLWFYDMRPDVFDQAGIALYLVTILILILSLWGRGHGLGLHQRLSGICWPFNKGACAYGQLQGAHRH